MAQHRKTSTPAGAKTLGAALAAGAVLLAPVGAATIAAPAAYAVPPGGSPCGTANPGCIPGGGTEGPGPTNPPGGDNMVVKKVIRLPGLKVEIKNIRGDGKPPKLKIVPLPGLKRLLHPPTNPGGGDGVPGGGDGGTPGG